MDNPFFKFLAELATRLFSKNPKFFAQFQFVSLVIGGLSGLVHYLKSIGVQVPGLFSVLDNVTIMISSVLTIILAQLPNDTSK